MKELAKLLKKHGGFLKTPHGFHMTESYEAESFGNEGVSFERGALQLRIVKDRGVFSFEFHPAFDRNAHSWYDLDLIQKYLENPDAYVLSEEEKRISLERVCDSGYQLKRGEGSLSFLNKNLENIIELFSESNYPLVKEKMKTLMRQRSKQLFGPSDRRR